MSEENAPGRTITARAGLRWPTLLPRTTRSVLCMPHGEVLKRLLTFSMTPPAWGRLLGFALMSLALAASPASGAIRVGHWRAVAPHKQLAGDCAGLYQGEPQPGFRFEPVAASNPRRPKVVSVAWIQGSAQGILAATSRDGGRNWTAGAAPQTSSCTGGQRSGAADPWLSYGPHGTLYLTAIPADLLASPLLFSSEVFAYRSQDAGRSWSAPSTVAPLFTFNDKASVRADPHTPRLVYATYSKRTGLEGEDGSLFFKSSSDAARTWSPERTVYLAPPLLIAVNGQVLRLPDGTLVDIFDLVNESEQLPIPRVAWQVMAATSSDGGTTWSAPGPIATLPAFGSRFFADDGSGSKILAGAISSTAASPGGRLYAAWQANESDQRSEIRLASSLDGQAWTTREVAKTRSLAVQPTVAAGRHGLVGVTWFDFRPGGKAGDPLPARLRFAYSRDAGKTWHRRTIRRFDYHRAPRTGEADKPGRPLFLGDYFGLTPIPHGFLTAVTLPSRSSTRAEGDSQLYTARIVLRRDAHPSPISAP